PMITFMQRFWINITLTLGLLLALLSFQLREAKITQGQQGFYSSLIDSVFELPSITSSEVEVEGQLLHLSSERRFQNKLLFIFVEKLVSNSASLIKKKFSFYLMDIPPPQ